MSKQKKGILVALLLAVTAAASFYIVLWKPETEVPQAKGEVTTSVPEEEAIPTEQLPAIEQSTAAAVDSPAVPRPFADNLPPLPPTNLPLADQFGDLMARAEAGDPKASCRLLIGLNRCIEHNRNVQFTDRAIQSLERKGGKNEELSIQLAAAAREREARSDGYCSGLPKDSLPRLDDILANAIHYLDARQKTILAMMRSDGQIRRLVAEPSLSEMGLYVYPQVLADNAYAFLQAGFQARDPLALEGLILLHSPGMSVSPLGVALRLPNPRLFLKYAWLMERLYGAESLGRAKNMVASTTMVLLPDELEAVRREVDAEFERWMRTPSKLQRPDTEHEDALSDC